LKLVVFGLTVTSSWGNGHATLWRLLCRALARRGHRVTFFERDLPWYAGARDLLEVPGLEVPGLEVVVYPEWYDARQVDPEAHRPVPPVEGYRADLSYLGTYAADRQAMLERLFIEVARRLPARRFVIGGALYPQDFPWATNIHFVRRMPPPHHPAFFSSSRLTLNVTRRAMAELGWCPAGRIFEAAACGAPVVSDWWEGMDHFYTPGEEIVIARRTEDILAALDLGHAELRRIAERARQRTLEEHCSDRRATELEAALEGIGVPIATEA
jgi:spore maturation protein CgeB